MGFRAPLVVRLGATAKASTWADFCFVSLSCPSLSSCKRTFAQQLTRPLTTATTSQSYLAIDSTELASASEHRLYLHETSSERRSALQRVDSAVFRYRPLVLGRELRLRSRSQSPSLGPLRLSRCFKVRVFLPPRFLAVHLHESHFLSTCRLSFFVRMRR